MAGPSARKGPAMSVIDQVFFLVLDLFDAGFELVMPVVLALYVLSFGSAMVRLCY